ncbi:MAG TPA: ester cyclase [Gaiellaceae bacterium]|nr:ester cyclase [Gaiellaceae bacterium]
MADLERNKALTRRIWEEAWRDHRTDVGDEVFSSDIRQHVMGGTVEGIEAMRATLERWLAAFPDLSAEVDMQVAEGDLVAERVTFRGTHSGGPFRDIEPSGASFTFTQTTICRVADRKIAEMWEDVDWAGLMRQLGVS